MARSTTQLRKPKESLDLPDPDLLAHICALGLGSIEDYQDWCEAHGFSRRVAKHWRQRLKERAFATRAAADARLAQKKVELRRPSDVIEKIFLGNLPDESVTHPPLAALYQGFKSLKQSPRTREAMFNLAIHVCKNADLLTIDPVIPEYGCQAGNSFIGGLLAVAQHWRDWIRPIQDWRPRTHNARRQFASLVRHLFARWPVPAFMDSVWFRGDSPIAVERQKWFLHVGGGESIRTARLPLPYTKRMAHHFMRAPADLSVEAALRWGQIHGLGGDERLVRSVIGTRMATQFDQEDFWVTALRWLTAHPMLDSAQVGPIIDYLQHQKFEHHDVILAAGVVERRGPPQPNLTMYGRTPDSLLRQVQDWHRSLAKTEQPVAEWNPSGIRGFEFIEGSEQGNNLKIWTVKELLSTKALVAEGRTQKHCVGSYARSCAAGRSSIWTMEVESFEGRRKVLTVELNVAARLISQARGKCNAAAAEKHRGILRRWAEAERLGIANWI